MAELHLSAGRLRHRVSIDAKTETQDETGDPVVTWAPWAEGVPAEIAPAKGAEFAALNQILGRAVVAIVIRWRPGVVRTMRVRHEGTIYNIVDAPRDPDSGREWIVMPCVAGTNQG